MTVSLPMQALPVFDNAMHSSYRAVKEFGDTGLTPSCFFMKIAHGVDIFGGISAVVVTLGKCWFTCLRMTSSCGLSALAHLIVHILGRRIQKQMGRVDTSRIVASVTNQRPVRDWIVFEFPGIAMRLDRPASWLWGKSSVTRMATIRLPYPTGIGTPAFVYEIPESFRGRLQLAFCPMMLAKAKWLTLDMSRFGDGFLGNIGLLPATTTAVSIAMRPILHFNDVLRRVCVHVRNYTLGGIQWQLSM